MTEKIELLPKFTKGEIVYFMKDNCIAIGKVVAVYDLDDFNSKYLVINSVVNRWMKDTEIFHTIKSLVEYLKSCIID